jgi:uncharacterized protein YndB with AHSA1/START domain
MVPDHIARDVLIEAPLETVWAIVTEPQHVGSWFSDSAEIDLRPGGEATLTWTEHGSVRARIEKVEPPHTFSFRWARPLGTEPDEGNSTLVAFSLSAEGDSTRLRVVETGFRELRWAEDEKAKYAQENEQGWDHELRELREYASKHVGLSARQ